ncbi:MAG: phenylalanine--tRNA ligase subunit beta [Deltaproteobacteria bacterium]|nr:phenylalanine--tRNA ligase subunit beta [Deltaproteobacteria bacterium]
MWVSWRWLSRWVDTQGVDPVAFAQRFTCTVAEIDGVKRWGFGLDAVLVADVVGVQPHPNGDKLRLATVDLGDRQTTVVCGAPDLRLGMRVPFVPVGVTLPSGIAVKDGEVRGVRSPGMLASEADLGLSDNHDGLLSLDGVTAPAGTPLPQALALGDVLYEVDNKSITHRPDLWGQYGMAREVAAMLDRPLRPLDLDVPLGQGQPVSVDVAAPDACPRYVCARVAQAAVAPAPVDARLLLRRLGVRPINNLVDATNLVMLETGNPLHAFDARHIRGGGIVVRRAAAGETMATLDGLARTLTAADVVIADAQGPVALAGVMGGRDSEIQADTRELILEAAAFDAATIRKTAMRLGMRTESSARFEKALDPELPLVAARRFLQTVLAWSPGAVVASDLLDAGPCRDSPPAQVTIHTTADYLRTRLGVSAAELDDAWLVACLRRLAFAVQPGEGGALTVAVPGFRATKDVRIAEDLVEELGRHYGYGRIASAAPQIAARPPHTSATRIAERAVRQALVLQQGLTELVLYGFDHEGQRARLGLHENDAPRLGVRNEIARDLVRLRRNLVPNLLAAAEAALCTGNGKEPPREGLTVQAFEWGRAFVPSPRAVQASDLERRALDRGVPPLAEQSDPDRTAWFARMDADMRAAVQATLDQDRPLPWQPLRLGIVCGERLGGGAEGSKRVVPDRAVSQRVFAQAVAAVDAALRALGKAALRVVPTDAAPDAAQMPLAAPDWSTSWRHPRRTAALATTGGQTVGLVTLVHPEVRNRLQAPAEFAVAELDVAALLALPDAVPVGHPPPRHAGSALDVTGRIAAHYRQAEVADALAQAAHAQGLPVEEVRYLYQAAQADGSRAVTWRLLCRAADRALVAEELGRIQQLAQAALATFAPAGSP